MLHSILQPNGIPLLRLIIAGILEGMVVLNLYFGLGSTVISTPRRLPICDHGRIFLFTQSSLISFNMFCSV